MQDKDDAIEVRNIVKSFRVYLDKGRTLKEFALFGKRRKFENRKVLDGISFNVKKGEALALIGHNGCGKSTTLKLLTKIMYPDSGEIEMSGRVSSLIELGAGFHPDMSGRENIYINASIFGLTKSEIDARLNTIIDFSELKDYIDNPVRTYSSGMYMRLAFSVAINVNADILLIDEILAVGDANFQAKCYEKMQELKAEGVTIVLVTHDMSTVKTFCNRAVWINEGKVMAIGKAGEVADQYLAYMNAERIEQITRDSREEAKRKKEISEKQINERKGETEKQQKSDTEQIPPAETEDTAHDPDINEGQKQKLTMDPNAIHYGNQKAVITLCEFLNKDKVPTEVVLSDENWFLRYHYKINEPMDELVFGIGIYTLDGLWVYGTNSLLAETHINVKGKKEGIVTFSCSPLNLLNGRFILRAAIQEINMQPCDFYNEYKRFNVIGPWNSDRGLVHYNSSWIQE